MKSTSGFTLVELIVALSLSVLALGIGLLILPTFAVTSRAQGRFEVAQATQRYFEQRSNAWGQAAAYGLIHTTDVPPDVTGYDWTLTACRVDTADTTYPCENAATMTSTTMAEWDASTGATAELVRLTLAYAPQGGTKTDDATITTSVEIARGGL